MRIQVRSTNIPMSVETQREIERRCHISLDHLESRVAHVMLHLSDLNGPRGGHDKRCRITTRLTDGTTVIIRATDTDELRAVGRALERTKHRLNESVKKRRRFRKGGPTIRQPITPGLLGEDGSSRDREDPWFAKVEDWVDEEAELQSV